MRSVLLQLVKRLLCERMDGRQTAPSLEEAREPQLRLAIVLSTSEDACTSSRRMSRPWCLRRALPKAPYRAVAPGNLVAIAATPDGSEVVVWRGTAPSSWERPMGRSGSGSRSHGEVLAQARDPRRAHRPGSPAYLSAGLAGDWWVAGPTVARAEAAALELDEVQRFFIRHDLWDRLT